MRTALLAATALAALAMPAHAALIASFSQNPSATPTITASDNGTITTISATDASTSITTGSSGIIPAALFSLSATSVSAALPVGSQVIQRYTGSFCFTAAAGCTGTNYLSGNFTDAAFGAVGGPGLTVNVNSPPDTLTLTSDVVPASSLIPPSSFNLGFANLSPLLNIDSATIGAFTADFAGNVSASAAAAPEPASFVLLGMGMLGLGMVRACRRAE